MPPTMRTTSTTRTSIGGDEDNGNIGWQSNPIYQALIIGGSILLLTILGFVFVFWLWLGRINALNATKHNQSSRKYAAMVSRSGSLGATFLFDDRLGAPGVLSYPSAVWLSDAIYKGNKAAMSQLYSTANNNTNTNVAGFATINDSTAQTTSASAVRSQPETATSVRYGQQYAMTTGMIYE